MYLINGSTGEKMAEQLNSKCEKGITYNNDIKEALAKAKAENIPLIAIHSHPEGYPPSVEDFRESLKTGLNRENRQGAPAARKADEARLYALRGGLTTQTACPVDFPSNKVFRDALQ